MENQTVTVQESDVHFTDRGFAVIENDTANKFIKETLKAEGAIEIGQPGSLRSDVNVNCSSCATNVYCPPKAVA
jgi:hypothetical protein